MKLKTSLLIVLVLIILISGVAIGEDLNSLSSAVRNNRDVSSMLGSEGKQVIFGLSRDLFDIARYVVITGLIVRAVMLFVDFSNAGDNAQLVAQIKSKVLWLSLGIIFSTNFWQIYSYASRIISSIRLL